MLGKARKFENKILHLLTILPDLLHFKFAPEEDQPLELVKKLKQLQGAQKKPNTIKKNASKESKSKENKESIKEEEEDETCCVLCHKGEETEDTGDILLCGDGESSGCDRGYHQVILCVRVYVRARVCVSDVCMCVHVLVCVCVCSFPCIL